MTARAIILRRRSERRAQRTSAATITVNCRALGKAMHKRLLAMQKAARAQRRRERRKRWQELCAGLVRLAAVRGWRRPLKFQSPWATWLAVQSMPGSREWIAEWMADHAIVFEARRTKVTP